MLDRSDIKYFETTKHGKPVLQKKYMGYCVQCNGKRARYAGKFQPKES